jgi:hypothetical protein
MGRSPFYADHVRPLKIHKPPLQELEEIFYQYFLMGDVIIYDDNIQVAKLKKSDEIKLQITECKKTPSLLLERCCSVYRKKEDYLPETNMIYKVKTAILYKFQNKYSNQEPFEFRVLEIQNIDTEYYTSFCITIEGSILNIESLSLRGEISKLVRL